MQRVLSNESDIATRKTNIPGELHPILSFSPNPGRVLKLVNKTERGQATGIPIFAQRGTISRSTPNSHWSTTLRAVSGRRSCLKWSETSRSTASSI